jgi:dynein heavy chain
MNVGSAGVGKSQTVLQSLSRLSRNFISCLFNFTAWTSAAFVSTIVESKLEKKNKKRFVPPNGRKLVITIDDVDMPKLEEYGAQPPIELLRQLLNEHGWYRNQTFASIDSTVLVCNLTVSERVQLSHRFLRKFVAIGISDFSEKELVSIFSSIVSQSYASIDQSLKSLIDSVVRSSVKVYKEMKAVMLPTPKTLHYSFTSRDLYRLFEGMCLAKADDLDS